MPHDPMPHGPAPGRHQPPRTLAISGTSGLVGKALTTALRADGRTVRPIVRRQPPPDTPAIYWNQAAGTLDPAALTGTDAVVHLAGESIIGRWTAAKRQRIITSRVDSTALLARTLAAIAPPPRTLIIASAVGYYGDRGDQPLDETAGPGTAGRGFLRRVCEQWEAAADPARNAGIRVIHTRIGMVLSRHGGALPTMLPAFKLGLGGRLGNGRQSVAWIHLDDLITTITTCLDDPRLTGPVNAVAPEPVTNAQLTATLSRILRRPAILPVPAPIARLIFGNLADELLLASQRVVPARLQAIGFHWRHPTLEAALRHLLHRPQTA